MTDNANFLLEDAEISLKQISPSVFCMKRQQQKKARHWTAEIFFQAITLPPCICRQETMLQIW